MRVLHIIPTAFNYFDDIKSFVFSVLDYQNNAGIEADAITLQFNNQDTKPERQQLKAKRDEALEKMARGEKKIDYPKYNYAGTQSISNALDDLSGYDIVHLHMPFFGGAKHILHWRAQNPQTNFIVSYYYDFKTPDFFGIIIKLYNYFYLPKMFKAATAVLTLEEVGFKMSLGDLFLKDKRKLLVLAPPQSQIYPQLTAKNFGVQLVDDIEKQVIAAEAMMLAYQFLTNSN